MTYDEFVEIFNDDEMGGSLLSKLKGDNALIGLNLIAKYISGDVLQGADHDIIYSASIDDLIEAGITKQDVEYLTKINWGINDDYLVCFV